MTGRAGPVAVIPARGGSRGVPGKNTATVGGVPLVVRAVRAALAARQVDRVLVSTDDDATAGLARSAGAEVVRRPAALSGDAASSESAVLHALAAAAPEATVVVLVQCTSPFVTAADIDAALEPVVEGSADCAFTAAPTHGFLWRPDGTGVNHEPASRPRRQDRPVQLLETGAAYAMRVDGLRAGGHRFFGRVVPVQVDAERTLEIDDPADLDRARLLADHLDGRPTTELTRHIGSRPVGPEHPVYVVAEIGINHNGSLDHALELIDVAVSAGCDAVKFQKRTPGICVPADQRDLQRDTPWGRMNYLDYRHRLEFGKAEYEAIARYSAQRGIAWFASPWDLPSVEFLRGFDVPAYKIASPTLTDDDLLRAVRDTGATVVLSTGMSTPVQIAHAVDQLDRSRLILCHATSSYPARPDELDLRMIDTLRREYPDVPVGYSGHEVGLQTTVAAVALGACLIERHITLDRAGWGSDQAASVEPDGLRRLVRDTRIVEAAMGDGVKRVHPGELAALARLRRVDTLAASGEPGPADLTDGVSGAGR